MASNDGGDRSCVDLSDLLNVSMDESMDVDKVAVPDGDAVGDFVDVATVEITPFSPSLPGYYLFLFIILYIFVLFCALFSNLFVLFQLLGLVLWRCLLPQLFLCCLLLQFLLLCLLPRRLCLLLLQL